MYFLDFLLDASAAFVSTLQQERKRDEEDEEMHTGTVTTTDPIIGIMATETLPRALNALFIIGNYEHGFEALLPLVADIHTIYHRLTELNVPLDTSPDWSDLFERVIFCTQAYKAVTISSSQVKFSIEDLSRLTCHLYVAGLFSGGATTLTNSSSQETSLCPFASFTRFFVTSCLAILADSHNIKPTQDLFLFFQRELSALLVENAIKSRHPNPTSLLIDTKAMFAYTEIPKHLLRWTLPPFVALRNGQTDALLEGLSSYMGKEAKDIFAVS